jgi:hypothetical protein
MFKKNLIIGSVIPVLLLAFALTGCPSPADGVPGGIGLAQLRGTVSAAQLEESFAIHNAVQIDGASTVEGLVPAGKTLIIGGSAGIGAVKPLIVNGRIEIKANARFDTTTGILGRESAGSIYTGGELVLAAQYYGYPIITAAAFEAGAVLSLPGANAATINEFFGKPGILNIKNDTVTLSGAHITALANWTGAKKLILESVTPLGLGGFDLSAETLGKLVIGAGVTVTIPHGGAVKAQAGAANITVAEGGKIVLPAATPDYCNLQGKIILDGGVLSAADGVATAAIPADVDLSRGFLTKEGTGAASTITLPDAPAAIGGIIVSDDLVIAGPGTAAVISAGVISGTAGKSLTLSAATVEAGEIAAPAGGALTIAGSAAAALKPARVSGGPTGVLTFDNTTAAVTLSGPIELSAVITIPDLLNLGQSTDQLAQLARITGGTVNLPAITFNGATAADTVFSTRIAGQADVDITISSSCAFTEGLFTNHTSTGGKVISAGASGPITVTLGKDSVFAGGLDITGTGGVTIAGKGGLALTGALTAAGPLAFTGGDVTLRAGANTLTGTVLTVGPGTVLSAGGLSFTEGAYTAAGTITIDAGAGAISGAAPTDALALGNNDPAAAKPLTLAGGGANGTFTLTGTNAAATLSGIGNGAMVVTPNGDNAVLTVGAAAELKLGEGIIALGYDPSGTGFTGSLALATGAKVSGFTYNGTALQPGSYPYQPSFTTGSQGVLGKYYTDGIAITPGNGTYAYDGVVEFAGTITSNSTSYAARPIHGGIITKNSDVAR